jgi:hypothetical protein
LLSPSYLPLQVEEGGYTGFNQEHGKIEWLLFVLILLIM